MADPYKLFDLKYSPDALEPYIDEQTVKLHHGKHAQAYVDNANKALEALRDSKVNGPLAYEFSKMLDDNAGGILTHQLYFDCLAKPKEKGGKGGEELTSGPFFESVKKHYGGFEGLKEALKKGGMGRFGSGWVFLLKDLSIVTTPNQEFPRGKKPILGIDVWEHSYYLKYQNRRAEYLDNIFHLINWHHVAELYEFSH